MTKSALADRHLHSNILDMTAAEREVLAFVWPLSPDYPRIDDWFTGKVVPGLRAVTRRLVRIDRQGQIAALGIAKAEGGEAKICTVRIAPEFCWPRHRHTGLRGIDGLAGHHRPLVTVSETKLGDFQRIFDHYGYRLMFVCTGLYVPGRAEYIFNEPLSPWGHAVPNIDGLLRESHRRLGS